MTHLAPMPARRRMLVLAAAAAAALSGLAASGAQAATTCTHSTPGLLEVNMSAHQDLANLETAGGAIRVSGGDGLLTCAGTAPTTGNVDTVLIVDGSDDPSTAAGHDGDTMLSIDEPAAFSPGKTAEPGQLSEIEFLVDPRAGRDELGLGGFAPQQLVVGNDGAAWNSDADAEMAGMPFDQLVLHGADGADHISGQGGAGTGGPLASAAGVRMYGGSGDDGLYGSDSRDQIIAGTGADSSVGYAGDDTISPGPGDDTLQGGSGTDALDFSSAVSGVAIDLANVQRQDTGEGRDSFVLFENVVGTAYADRLTGGPAAEALSGGDGDDTLEGAGGADELRGDEGTDAVSYAESTAPVSADLSRTTQPTDGDKLFSVESLIGSPFADTLIGNAVGNRIVGGAGADSIAAGGGPDRVEVRDGEGDRAGCGDGADTAIADRLSLDVLDACESVDALPEPAGPQQPGGAADGSLRFSASAAKVQRVLRRRSVLLRVRCPLEACTTVTAGSATLRRARSSRRTTRLRLGPVTTKVAAGAVQTLRVRLSRRQLAALRRAHATGQSPVLKLTARARDAAGNRVSRTLRITAKR